MKNKTAIIGAGASGMFCASQFLEAGGNGADISVFEGSEKILQKLKMSGGGRCNFTNANISPETLEKFYPRGARNLKFPIKNFTPQDAINFFSSLGVKCKEEYGGRVFPASNDSAEISQALEWRLKKGGAKVFTNKKLEALNLNDDGTFLLNFSDGNNETFKNIVFAIGGTWGAKLKKNLEEIGVGFTPPCPSLFSLKVASAPLENFFNLQACVLKNIEISPCGSFANSLKESKNSAKKVSFKIRGDALITHFGIGGPAALKFSSFFARELFERSYIAEISLNLIPRFNNLEREVFASARSKHPRGEVKNFAQFNLPQNFWKAIFENQESKTFANFGKKDEAQLLEFLKNFKLKISGKSTHKAEFVTCGGVETKQIDFSTMAHRKINNLYFLGECLDIDGITGGFNLHAAFATAKMCALALAKADKTAL